jgi:uncharacterized membrane protein
LVDTPPWGTHSRLQQLPLPAGPRADEQLAFVPALVAVPCGLLFLPDQAPLIAFAAGMLGPLIGADLLHLQEIERIGAGVASIGGAGTFDGIVLSPLIATLLA